MCSTTQATFKLQSYHVIYINIGATSTHVCEIIDKFGGLRVKNKSLNISKYYVFSFKKLNCSKFSTFLQII